MDPATGELVGATIEEQTAQVMRNVAAILEAAGTDFGRVIKTTCYLDDMADFAAFKGSHGDGKELPRGNTGPARPDNQAANQAPSSRTSG